MKLLAKLYVLYDLIVLLATFAYNVVVDYVLLKTGIREYKNKKKNNYFLRGAYEPVHDELDPCVPLKPADKIVDGDENLEEVKFPDDLPEGMFIRNGPNPVVRPKGNYHWFDGDSMLHGIIIPNKEERDSKGVYYMNRFLRTEKFNKENEFEEAKSHGIEYYLNPLNMLDNLYLKYVRGEELVKDGNTGNTALVFHNNKLMALMEGAQPVQVKVPSLDYIDKVNYDGKLKKNMTAHPKVCSKTGEMVYFGYNVLKKPYIHYGVVTKDGELDHTTDFSEAPWPSMIHDFMVTENYSIFPFYPLIFEKEKVIKNEFPIYFDENKKTKFAIVSRRYKDGDKIHWFEYDPVYAFHNANSYEEIDTNGDTLISVIACKSDYMDINFKDENSTNIKTRKRTSGYLFKWTFNINKGTVSSGPLKFTKENTSNEPETIYCDFPAVNPNFECVKNRFIYATRFGSNFIEMDSFVKCDLNTLTYKEYKFDQGCISGEWCLVVKEGKQDGNEDDMYAMSYVINTNTKRTTFEILDAQSMDVENDLVKVPLPRRVPLGFHSIFVSKDQIESQDL